MFEYIIKESVKNQSIPEARMQLVKLMADLTGTEDVESELDQKLIEDIDDLGLLATGNKIEYVPEPKAKQSAVNQGNIVVYPRDRMIAVNALIRANHQCEIDQTHPSFIRKSSKKNYTEPHHLIPMAYQGQFNYSLDVEANIISLCSNCHNQIHYGESAEVLIEKLYNLRKDELEKAKIHIDLEALKALYK